MDVFTITWSSLLICLIFVLGSTLERHPGSVESWSGKETSDNVHQWCVWNSGVARRCRNVCKFALLWFTLCMIRCVCYTKWTKACCASKKVSFV